MRVFGLDKDAVGDGSCDGLGACDADGDLPEAVAVVDAVGVVDGVGVFSTETDMLVLIFFVVVPFGDTLCVGVATEGDAVAVGQVGVLLDVGVAVSD